MTGNELRRGSGSTVRWLILIHRYLGIPLSVLFLVWFASGIVMMYTRDMPRLTPELRLERLPELDLDRIALAPAAAAGRAHLSPTPRSALLLTVLDRPAYRFDGVTVFGDTGERLDAVGPTAATAVASRFTGRPREAVEYVGTLTEPDQWTLVERSELPLHRFVIDDDAGTELYVSPRTAEVVMLTTRRSRALAWIGAIPHWFYFTALRGNQPRAGTTSSSGRRPWGACSPSSALCWPSRSSGGAGRAEAPGRPPVAGRGSRTPAGCAGTT